MSQRNKAIAALVLTALLWSIGGVLIKWVTWHPMAIMGARSAIAALVLWIVARRPRIRWSTTLVGAAVAYAVTVALYVPAVTLTTAANAIMLQYTAPLWIALFGAWFLGERATWIDWLCILVSLGGMVLFFHEGLASKSFVGDLLGALSGITLAWSMLLLRKQKDGTPLECVLLGNVLAALGGLPFAFGRPVPNAMGWVALLYLGIMQLGLAYALYAWAIKHVTALESVLIVMLEPILNPIWALLLIGERPQGWALVGGLLVLAAATMRGVLLAVHKPRSAAAP